MTAKKFNPWWPILALLGCVWIIPMIEMRRTGLPRWLFPIIAAFWIAVFLGSGYLYEWGIRIRRKLGMTKLADWGERMKDSILPPARLALLLMALISLCFGII